MIAEAREKADTAFTVNAVFNLLAWVACLWKIFSALSPRQS
jgi:hypothetical protein